MACIVWAIYVGAWFCFVGGARQIIEGAEPTPVDVVQLALGILRVAVSVPMGWVAFWLGLSLMSWLGLLDKEG